MSNNDYVKLDDLLDSIKTLSTDTTDVISVINNLTKYDIETMIKLNSQDKFNYGKYIRHKLDIKKSNKDYEAVKNILFYELGVTKWEDIQYSEDVISRIDRICEKYTKVKYKKLY